MIRQSLSRTPDARRHVGAMSGWDNTARRLHHAFVVHGATPAKFRRWLRGLLRAEHSRSWTTDRLILINAWNEWAEGAYLEPDRTFGHGWLEAVASATAEPVASLVAPPKTASARILAADMSPNPLDDQQWLQLLVEQAESGATGSISLPPFPAIAWQAQFVGSSGAHTMREAFAFYTLLKSQLAKHGILSPKTRVLDFGCGWGRFIRLFMKDITSEALHGADVDPDMIGFCRISGLPAQFAVVPPLGPTLYPDADFDLIFAYSVFSHLSEDAYRAWMQEFVRILRPGGLVVFTTQARRFIEWTATLRDRPEAEVSDWERSLRFAFGDISTTLRDYESGQFIFAPTGGGNHRPSSFYGEAVIPEVYFRATTATGSMAFEEFIDDAAVCPQAIVVMRRQPINAKETNLSPAASKAPHPPTPARALPDGANGHVSTQVSERSNNCLAKISDRAPTRNGLSYPLVPRDAWLEIVTAAYRGQYDARVPTYVLPGFPPDELQIATTGHAGRATLDEAHTFYVDCAETFERLGRPLERASMVLDFGVGWGRVGRFFLNDIAPENLIGIDVDHTLVTMCRSLFSASRFEICSSHPPTELAAHSIDFVVGYSVFSHLSEAACIAWMSEFGRLLRPGGIAALTTRGRWFFDYCASLRDTVTDGYARGLSTLFSDFEAAIARYDAGELVFSTNSDVAGGVRDSRFYGETFIPESYAARAFPDMKLAEFQFEARHHTHPIMFFVRQG